MYPAALRAAGKRQREEVRILSDHAELWNARRPHVVANLAKRRVVPYHDGQTQARFDGRHEFHYRELQSEIARQGDDCARRTADLGAERCGQRKPQGSVSGWM